MSGSDTAWGIRNDSRSEWVKYSPLKSNRKSSDTGSNALLRLGSSVDLASSLGFTSAVVESYSHAHVTMNWSVGRGEVPAGLTVGTPTTGKLVTGMFWYDSKRVFFKSDKSGKFYRVLGQFDGGDVVTGRRKRFTEELGDLPVFDDTGFEILSLIKNVVTPTLSSLLAK